MLKLLIVEDEEIIRKGLQYAIDWLSLGCVVEGAASDGEEGLSMIREIKPDVVLTDIKMPGMSGLEMIERGLTLCPFQSIVLTSYSEFDLAKQAMHMGVTDYLLKPVDEDELAQSIAKIKLKMRVNDKAETYEKLAAGRNMLRSREWQVFEIAETSMDRYVRSTYEEVARHYTERLSVNDVAGKLGVSASFLSRRLKAGLSLSFTELLNRYRIHQSLRLLKEGKLRINEVSDAVGFQEYKYFAGVFKHYLGVTPTEYQKSADTVLGSASVTELENKAGSAPSAS